MCKPDKTHMISGASTYRRAGLNLSWYGLFLPLCAALGCGEPSASIFIDNGFDQAMILQLDDKEAARIEPGQVGTISLPPGTYLCQVVCDGRTLFNGRKTIEPSESLGTGRQYVWNPGGDFRYAACKVIYGSLDIGEAAENAIVGFAETYSGQKADPTKLKFIQLKRYAEPMPATTWFELPAGISYVLRNPPEHVYSRTGSDSRRALTRISPDDHAQLQHFHALEQPSSNDVDNLFEVTQYALDSLENLTPSL